MSTEVVKTEMDICSSRKLAELYLRFGSVEEALKHYPELPISVPDFHRKIKKYGIVKGIGRRAVSLAEVLNFFAEKVLEPNFSIEKLYRRMSYSLRKSASVVTLYRIYEQMMERVVRTYAAALVITNSDRNQILVADEKMQNLLTGKVRGSTSLLMSFAVKDEPFYDSVLRVLQREFSTELTLQKRLTRDGDLSKEIVSPDISPFMYLHLLDVKVAVFHLELPDYISENLGSFTSSYKVGGHRFMPISDLLSGDTRFNLREGVSEIVEGFQNYLLGTFDYPVVKNALLNEAVLALSESK